MEVFLLKIISKSIKYINRIESLYQLYVVIEKITSENEVDFVIKTTSDIQKAIYRYSSLKERSEFDRVGIPKLNGIVIMPKNDNLKFTILLDTKLFKDDQIVHTAMHEFTHLFDYNKYFLDYGNVYIMDKEFKELKYFYEFYHWSEFHSKRIGTYIYCIYKWHQVHGNKMPKGLYSFKNVDFHTDSIIKEINILKDCQKLYSAKINDYFWNFFSELMGYYGRMGVFQEENSDTYPDRNFPKDVIIKNFGIDAIKLYNLMLEMDTYDKAINNLEKLRKFIKPIIEKFNIA